MRPYMRAANVTWDGISLHDVKEMDFSPREFEVYRLRPGDILLSEASGSASEVGKPALWRGEVEAACFQNTLLRVRCRDTALAPFLHLRFQDDARNGRFARAAKGVGIHHLGAEAMSGWQVGVAPLAEQRRIVAESEKQFTRLDAAVATLEGVRAKLKRARASVIKAAVEGRLVPTEAEVARQQGRPYEPAPALLTRLLEERRRRWPEGKKYKPPVEPETGSTPSLPDGWTIATIDQIADVGTGATPARGEPRYWQNGTVPWVNSAVVNEPVVSKPSAFVTPDALHETNLTLFPAGTLLVAMYGEGQTRGRVSRLAIEATTNQALAAVALSLGDPLVSYVRWVLESRYQALRGSASGGVQPNLNLGIIRAIAIPLPPIAEQERIVAEVERRLSVLDALERTVEQNLARCARLRQSILKRAFEGRLVPQDPTDEPASALLARLRGIQDASEALHSGTPGRSRVRRQR